MLPRLIQVLSILALTASQEAKGKLEVKEAEVAKPQIAVATPLSGERNSASIPEEVSEFFARQQYSPEVYGLTYLQPKYQSNAVVPRLQPQLVLLGPGGQGQPILINPGNPPGNFLIPQRPGPNIIVRNSPQTPGFPSAGYPKPAHIPPIEKDAEEIPTNPAKVPPFQSGGEKPGNLPNGKPEKLEMFNEPNSPELGATALNGESTPFIYNLQPGQRFFILNGQDIYNNYPYEAQDDDLSAFRYANTPQQFPQHPPNTLQPLAELETPSQFLSQFPQSPISIPELLLRNSFMTPNQPINSESSSKSLEEKTSDKESIGAAQQFFRSAGSPYEQSYLENPRDSTNSQLSSMGQLDSKNEVIQPTLVGQFRFQPEKSAELYQFQDDVDNDAVVVEASFDEPNTRKESTVVEESENDTSNSQAETEESEPSMAQAGPQATAIAGPGGVAGSAPRGTAIVGAGGLAISSPQATAVAGNKDDEKKVNAEKKEA